MFNTVVLATDEKFKNFVPIVSYAWRAYFPGLKREDIKVAFVTNRDANDPIVKKMELYCQPILFPEIEDIPTANIAKMARFVVASLLPEDKIAMIEDIDTIPLQSQYYINKAYNMANKPTTPLLEKAENTLLLVGEEVYKNTEHEGKFPISTMTAFGKTFSKLVNPDNLNIGDLFTSWKGIKCFDHKEDISSPDFSDESLWRVLIDRNQSSDDEFKVNIKSVNRDVSVLYQWLDRSWWGQNLDTNKLASGFYVTCNFKRPMEVHYSDCAPIFENIMNRFNTCHNSNISPTRDVLLLESDKGIEKQIGKHHWIEKIYGLNFLVGPHTHPGDGSVLSHEGEAVVFTSMVNRLNQMNLFNQKPVMIELGSNFALYSLIFKQMNADAKNVLIELVNHQLKVGEANFEINNMDYSGYLGGIGLETSQTSTDAGNDAFEGVLDDYPEFKDFIGMKSGDASVGKEISLDFIWEKENLSDVDLLHADIQGSESQLMDLLKSSNKIQNIKSIFIATHSTKLHDKVTAQLQENNFEILFNCPWKGKFHYSVNHEEKVGGFGDDGFLIAYNKNFTK